MIRHGCQRFSFKRDQVPYASLVFFLAFHNMVWTTGIREKQRKTRLLSIPQCRMSASNLGSEHVCVCVCVGMIVSAWGCLCPGLGLRNTNSYRRGGDKIPSQHGYFPSSAEHPSFLLSTPGNLCLAEISLHSASSGGK